MICADDDPKPDGKGWSGGPHLFIANDGIWEFNRLTKPGVHAPSWNKVALGVDDRHFQPERGTTCYGAAIPMIVVTVFVRREEG